jgi:hypothetical protein
VDKKPYFTGFARFVAVKIYSLIFQKAAYDGIFLSLTVT